MSMSMSVSVSVYMYVSVSVSMSVSVITAGKIFCSREIKGHTCNQVQEFSS